MKRPSNSSFSSLNLISSSTKFEVSCSRPEVEAVIAVAGALESTETGSLLSKGVSEIVGSKNRKSRVYTKATSTRFLQAYNVPQPSKIEQPHIRIDQSAKIDLSGKSTTWGILSPYDYGSSTPLHPDLPGQIYRMATRGADPSLRYIYSGLAGLLKTGLRGGRTRVTDRPTWSARSLLWMVSSDHALSMGKEWAN